MLVIWIARGEGRSMTSVYFLIFSHYLSIVDRNCTESGGFTVDWCCGGPSMLVIALTVCRSLGDKMNGYSPSPHLEKNLNQVAGCGRSVMRYRVLGIKGNAVVIVLLDAGKREIVCLFVRVLYNGFPSWRLKLSRREKRERN